MIALGRRTYTSRSYVNGNSWSYDALHAARLGLGADVKTALLAAIRSYQTYPSGMASFNVANAVEPYIEQAGVLAATVPEALVQHYDGVLRIAPAWPSDWTGEGTVAIPHNSKVSVQISGGTATTVAIASGANQQLDHAQPVARAERHRGGRQTRATVVGPQTNATFTIPAQSGKTYLVERTGSPTNAQPFEALTGTPATAARKYDRATIGLPKATSGTGTISLRARANGRYVTAGTGTPLIANSTTIGTAQQFEMADLGGGNVSLRAKVNNLLVAADNAGAGPLIAKNTAVGSWETFQLIRNRRRHGQLPCPGQQPVGLRRQRRSRAADRQPDRDRPVGIVRPDHQLRSRDMAFKDRRRKSLLVALTLTVSMAVGVPAADAGSTIPPADYQQINLASGSNELGEAMSLAVLPDRTVVHTARDGNVRVTDAAGNTKVAGKLNVYTHDEEGLQGVAADPGLRSPTGSSTSTTHPG